MNNLEKNLNTIIQIAIYFGLFFAVRGKAIDWNFKSFLKPLSQIYHFNQYAGFDIIVILFILSLLFFYNKHFVLTKLAFRIIAIQTLFLLFILFNPYNSFYKSFNWFFFFGQIPRTTIVSSILIGLLFSLSLQVRIFLTKNMLHVLLVLGKIGIVFDLLILAVGGGPQTNLGFSVSSVSGLTVFWYSFIHILYFSIYMHSQNKKDLLWSVLSILAVALSYKRTAFFMILIFDSLIFILFTLYLKRNIFKKFMVIGILLFLSIFFLNNTELGFVLKNRMGAAISFTGLVEVEGQGPQYTDSGHFLQSQLTTNYILSNFTFWGGGINKRNEDYLKLEGQSSGGVHSNFAAIWQYLGLPGLIYYFLLILFFLSNLIKHLKVRVFKNFNELFVLSISLFFIIKFVAGWFSGDFFFIYITHYWIYIIPSFFLITIKQSKFQNFKSIV